MGCSGGNMEHILLVEDDIVLRRCLKGVLEKQAYQVDEASTMEEAVEKSEARVFDLIVTDYKLGSSRSGLSLLVYLKKNEYHSPVILMSGWRPDWLKPISLKLGAHAFLEKPFPMRYFIDACGRCLKGRDEPGLPWNPTCSVRG